MQLNREFIASEALKENIDLKRLHHELIAATAYYGHAIGTTMGWLVPPEKKEIFERLKTATYEESSEGKWKALLEMSHLPSDNYIDHLESLISVQGEHCRIDTKRDLECLRATHQIVGKGDSFDIFLHTLAETAVTQTLDRIGINATEHRLITSEMDIQLHAEERAITELVYEQLKKLLLS